MRLLHWMTHLFRLNGCLLERRKIEGHEWLALVCDGCKMEKPFIHSAYCDCKREPQGPTKGAE